MSLLSNLKTDSSIQEDKDVLGGGYKAFDSDIYDGVIRYAYLQKANSSNALSLNLCVDIDGKEYKETMWISNRNGDNYYEKDGNKNYLPSFTIANHIALFTCQKELSNLDTEEKVISIYNWEQRKEVPTAVPCITDLHGKKVSLAIMKEIVNKQTKDASGNYVPTDETKEQNNIVKVFHPENHKTVVECKAKAEQPEFYEKWLEKNKGQIKDNTTKSSLSMTNKTNQSKSVSSLFA